MMTDVSKYRYKFPEEPIHIKGPAILAGKHVMYLWQIKALYRTSVLTHKILSTVRHGGYYFPSFSGISYYQHAIII